MIDPDIDIDKLVELITKSVWELSKKYAPGKNVLSNSIKMELGATGGRVYSNLYFASKVEHGEKKDRKETYHRKGKTFTRTIKQKPGAAFMERAQEETYLRLEEFADECS